MPAIPWTAVETAGSILSIIGLALLTIARPFVRERTFKLLRGDAGKHRNFVLDAVKDKESRSTVADIILDTISDPRYSARHRDIIAQQWKEEIAANREARQLAMDRSRLLDQYMASNTHLHEVSESTAAAVQQLTSSVTSLVTATERLVTVTDDIAAKTQDTAERVARLEGSR
jgi:hypothetical protein